MKILVVDDDVELLPLIAFALRQGGFFCLEAASGEQALRLVGDQAPDLIILDLGLPGIDGLEVLRRVRAGGSRVPVLVLTARDREEDEVKGLDAGADDYLTKPFSPRTLLARVRALLRRTGIEASRTTSVGDLELLDELQSVRLGGGEAIRLTPLEYRLLRFLAAQSGRPVQPERILLHVWGTTSAADRQLLKQLVHRLRQKIEIDPAAPRRLCTEAGLGYRLGV